MKQIYSIIGLITATLLLLPSNSTYAQFGFGSSSSYATPLFIGREWGLWTQSQNSNTLNKNITESLNTKKRNLSVTPLKLLTYKVSTTVRRRNLAQFVERTREVDPDGAEKLEQFLGSNNVIDQIDKAMMTIGLKSNNVADAYAVYWTNAWLGANGRSEDLSRAQMIAVRNQAAEALLKIPQFKSATDAQKQEMCEAMLIQSALISATIDSAKSDPVLTEKVKAAVDQGAKGMGLDLDRMTLTPQGFRSLSN
jgi:hypothetical protein